MTSSTADLVGELLISIVCRKPDNPVSFIDYEPRTVGCESDIAAVLGREPHETDALLAAVDDLDHHFKVLPVILRARGQGSKGEVIPAKIRKIILPV